MLCWNTEYKLKSLELDVDMDDLDKIEQSDEALNDNDGEEDLFGGNEVDEVFILSIF